jgi:hypothetical protein
MTNEDLERAREFAHHKLAESVNPLGIDDPDRWVTWLAEFRADGEREVFERCCKIACIDCRKGKEATYISSYGWTHGCEDNRLRVCEAHDIRAAFPEYARTEEQKS